MCSKKIFCNNFVEYGSWTFTYKCKLNFTQKCSHCCLCQLRFRVRKGKKARQCGGGLAEHRGSWQRDCSNKPILSCRRQWVQNLYSLVSSGLGTVPLRTCSAQILIPIDLFCYFRHISTESPVLCCTHAQLDAPQSAAADVDSRVSCR